jgi:hypothetical protein
MDLLSRDLRDATVVSIGHCAELADFHHRKITLLRSRGGARIVSDPHPARSASPPAGGRDGHGYRAGPFQENALGESRATSMAGLLQPVD